MGKAHPEGSGSFPAFSCATSKSASEGGDAKPLKTRPANPPRLRSRFRLQEQARSHPFAYIYIVGKDAAKEFHPFRQRWIKDGGRWIARGLGLVVRQAGGGLKSRGPSFPSSAELFGIASWRTPSAFLLTALNR